MESHPPPPFRLDLTTKGISSSGFTSSSSLLFCIKCDVSLWSERSGRRGFIFDDSKDRKKEGLRVNLLWLTRPSADRMDSFRWRIVWDISFDKSPERK